MSVIVGEYHELLCGVTLRMKPYPIGTIVRVIGLSVNTDRHDKERVTIECENGEVYHLDYMTTNLIPVEVTGD